MSFSLYPKLALGGMRKNARLYVPYLLTSAGMVMMTYILAFLAFSPLTTVATGTSGTAMILNLGIFVVAGFAALFLFYTNSFLIRRREREFGLYSVLGMGKFNLALILLFEALFTAAISLVAGLLGGMLFSKIAEVGLLRLIGADFTYKLTVSPSALVFTVTIYLIIFGLILLRSVSRVGFRSAADLTKSENVGEKPPKGNIFLGIAGVLLLGFAYWLAVTIKDPVAALTLFFVAVLMVIAATYMIFISGSVVFCRLLQKNKRYYYNKRHFVSVSSMVYRMKRNGAGLASICILATMVLVMISSTTCLYFGFEDSLRSIYPREINATAYFESLDDMSGEATDRLRAAAENTLTKEGYTGQNFLEWRRASCPASLKRTNIVTKNEQDAQYIQLIFVPLSDYNTAMGTNETLSDGETLVYSYRADFSGDSITINGEPFSIRRILTDFFDVGEIKSNMTPSLIVVVPDFFGTVDRLNTLADEIGAQRFTALWYYGFDAPLSPEEGESFYEDIANELDGSVAYQSLWSRSREANREEFLGIYGGLFFIGLILSLIFTSAAVLIIYYKQLSEGYEDAARFEIMQKVGMTKRDIRASINSQLLTVFFLPLIFAGLHLGFAFPFVSKMLTLFNLTNTSLLIMRTALSFFVFAVLYAAVYKITSSAYYKIVSGN